MSKTPVRADVADRLKQARARIFSTASEAADALEMKAVTLRAHENGQNGVNVYDLERYARRYNVSLQWLLTGKGSHDPDPSQYVELGEMVEIENTIEPAAWIPNDDPSRARQKYRRPELIEKVPYTDPRFPRGMAEAYKVGKASPLGHYITGTVLFCIDVSQTGFNSGDHVIVIRERGDFINVSVRRVVRSGRATKFESLTDPEEEDLLWEASDKEELPHVSGVIIGSLTRRPVRTVNLEALQNFEAYERSRRFGPREWREAIKEAKALTSGRLAPEKAEYFEGVDDADAWLRAYVHLESTKDNAT